MTRPAPGNSCFSQDTTRADGLSGHMIHFLMTSGPGTVSAQTAANAASALERSYAGVEARLKRVGETLGEAWTGASADAAQAAGNPINQAMIQMQDSLRQADHSLSNQVYQFNHNKSQLKNVAENKPETGFWDDATPWDTDTEDAVNAYNSDESHNRKVYSEFQSASNTNRGELPKEFPAVTGDNLKVEVTDTGGDDGRDKTGNNVGTTGMP
ncbi:MAG TPA: PPE domain-containing protein, partial [Lentzea sp.]